MPNFDDLTPGAKERDPRTFPDGKERTAGPFFGEEERATESLCEKDDIVMRTCYANKERSPKALSRPRKHTRTTRERCKLRQATETEERREYNSHTDTSETAG